MWDKYRRYSALPFWDGKANPETDMVKDAVLDALFTGIKSRPFLLWQDDLEKMFARTRDTSLWHPHHVRNFVIDVWNTLSVDGGKRVKTAIDRYGVQDEAPDRAPWMTSGGHCDNGKLYFRYDRSISDPIYMAHETGHLVADQDHMSQGNIQEIQAFFVQEAAYDLLINRNGATGQAARLHRLREYSGILSDMAHTEKIDRAKINKISPEEKLIYKLHRHVAGSIIGVAAYAKFKTMTPDQKEKALAILFDGGQATSLNDVLQTFKLSFTGEQKTAGRNFAESLIADAKEFGVLKPASSPKQPLPLSIRRPGHKNPMR